MTAPGPWSAARLFSRRYVRDAAGNLIYEGLIRTERHIRPPRFRTRLLAILLAFALVPAALLTLTWGMTLWRAAPLVTGSGAWEQVATSGGGAIAAAREARLTPAQRAALDEHEVELRSSLELARRYNYLASRGAIAMAVAALIALGLLALIASRVAGHLSRQLSRPLDEVIGWTEKIAHGDPLPDAAPRRGAPEFETLRVRMRQMAAELQQGRQQAIEAERLRAFQESARQVAHELKNPLTPIRLATERIASEGSDDLTDAVAVLRTETGRLERMARSFAQFGRLPEGIVADIDMGELATYAANSTVPEAVAVSIDVAPATPLVRGHHDTLAGALSNVLLNAVEACDASGRIEVKVSPHFLNGTEAVRITVTDNGCGIAAPKLARIWDPYITDKPGGTGLGLAIARQAVLAQGGSVSASSSIGEGTTIELVIPTSPPVQQ
jgi:nitrogen fixation/metabolism regulation signal transduction histidine kinase